MINLVANNWEDAWIELHRLYAEEFETIVDRRFATRAMSFDNKIVVANNDIGKLDIKLVGYTVYKLNLFDRRYIIPGMKEKILETLLERIQAGRKLTVISYPFREDDGAHTQGPCLVNMILTLSHGRDGWSIEFDIYARIGEITRRIMVDFLKFHEIIQYFLDELKDYNIKQNKITFHTKAIYAESISLTIAEHLFEGQFSYDKDYWLHRDVRTKIARFNEGDIKFKRGRRIRKQMLRLQEGRND